MSISLSVTPGGNIRIEGDAALAEAFASGRGAGLLAMLKGTVPADAPGSFHFFRRLAREYAARLCRMPEADPDAMFEAARPDPEAVQELLFDRPPMSGGEYLTAGLIGTLFLELEGAMRAGLAASGGSPSEYLRTLSPAWESVGKVSFHLAANGKNEDGQHPFAFLATFIHRLSENDQPRHLPLATALKTFAADRKALLALLLPVRQAAEKSELVARMLADGSVYHPCVWTPAEAHAFVRDIPAFEEADIVVRFANLWKKRPPKLQAQLSLDVGKRPSRLNSELLLKFTIQAVIGDEKLSEAELEELLNSGGGLVRIKGEWVDADPENVRKLLKQWGALPRETLTLAEGARILAGAAAEFPQIDSELLRVEATAELEAMLSGDALPEELRRPPLPAGLDATLRPYQKGGVDFLWRTTALGTGACLADDMGLGKTVQVLTWLELLRIRGELAEVPALLVLPASLLANWRDEAAKFTPQLRLKLLHGSALAPGELERFEADPAGFLSGCDLAVTTYAMAVRLSGLHKLEFPAVIADEAQALKNPNSNQSRAVRSLRSRRRVALSGTPVENRLTDLWSIFDFLSPGLLGTLPRFQESVKQMEESERGYAPLRRLTAPYILRRLKSDKSIIRDLPDKSEVNVFCTLTREQALLYRRVLDSMKHDLELAGEEGRAGVVLGALTHFKQICNHPAQFLGGGDFRPETSGKFRRLAELAEPIASRQEKVLVFTQFREMCEPLHEHLAHSFGRPGLVLHGGTPVSRRPELVREFQREDGPPFFVLSLKAAGTGLNLTAASHVIHFDRWWNPAVENQATDRAYRIGQHRNVLVHKFICVGTIEQRIDSMIRDKRKLADSLLECGVESQLMKMSPAELLKFAKLDLNSMEGAGDDIL
ncbi:MAG: DEAD/DEAH box helicase [Lentisphaeria bacterium]|nr:DEAD/DEAH box helicase [Lentisphaeria bacterium]